MPGRDNIDFSFSGLKTAALHQVRDYANVNKADVAASFQRVVIESLVSKTKRAAARYGVSEIVLGGGVAANQLLRKELGERLYPIPVMIPDLPYTGDNGAVIAAAAFYHNNPADWRTVQADPTLELPEEL
jgi:N6-L-threonylcarbamoyladenine synthase